MGCRSGDFPPINFTRRHHTSGGGSCGGIGGVILVDSGPTTGQPGNTRRHIVLFYGGNAVCVSCPPVTCGSVLITRYQSLDLSTDDVPSIP